MEPDLVVQMPVGGVMLSRSSWQRSLALLLIILVPVLALAEPLWCFATGIW
jgi:hypothetical protein